MNNHMNKKEKIKTLDTTLLKKARQSVIVTKTKLYGITCYKIESVEKQTFYCIEDNLAKHVSREMKLNIARNLSNRREKPIKETKVNF